MGAPSIRCRISSCLSLAGVAELFSPGRERAGGGLRVAISLAGLAELLSAGASPPP